MTLLHLRKKRRFILKRSVRQYWVNSLLKIKYYDMPNNIVINNVIKYLDKQLFQNEARRYYQLFVKTDHLL